MKEKKKLIIALLASTFVLASCGKTNDPVVVESETVESASSMVVTEESTELDMNLADETETGEDGLLRGSGTGDTVDLENEYDLAYENQLAEEESTEAASAAVIMYATGAVNVRDAASTTAQIVGKYQKNDMVFVYEIEGDWAKVNYEESQRYVNKNYLSSTKVEENTSAASTTKDNAGAQSQSKSQSENRISEDAAQNGSQTGTSENVTPSEDTTGRVEPEETPTTTPDTSTVTTPEQPTTGGRVFENVTVSPDYVPNHNKTDISSGYPGDPSEIEGITLH